MIFHLLRNVPVNVQSKGGCGVAQVALYGLDVIPVLEGQDGECMAEIMHPAGRDADCFHDFLEVIAERSL